MSEQGYAYRYCLSFVCLFTLGLFTSGLLLLGSAQAFAHTRLLSSEPADGEVVEISPPNIILHFSTAPESGYSRVQLAKVQLGNEALLGNKATLTNTGLSQPEPDKPSPSSCLEWHSLAIANSGKRLQVKLPALSAGRYRIRWSVLSSDGHRQNGTFGFTVR